jgi:hypothetical protein
VFSFLFIPCSCFPSFSFLIPVLPSSFVFSILSIPHSCSPYFELLILVPLLIHSIFLFSFLFIPYSCSFLFLFSFLFISHDCSSCFSLMFTCYAFLILIFLPVHSSFIFFLFINNSCSPLECLYLIAVIFSCSFPVALLLPVHLSFPFSFLLFLFIFILLAHLKLYTILRHLYFSFLFFLLFILLSGSLSCSVVRLFSFLTIPDSCSSFYMFTFPVLIPVLIPVHSSFLIFS